MTSPVIAGARARSQHGAIEPLETHMLQGDDLTRFIERYMAMWHEPDPERRRAAVAGLWCDDAVNLTRRFVVRGHDEITARVQRSHDEWVAAKGHVFRPHAERPADGHNDIVRFHWEMLPRAGGPLEARGLDFFELAPDGRIRRLVQFPEPLPAA